MPLPRWLLVSLAALSVADGSALFVAGRCTCDGSINDCSRRHLTAVEAADLCPDASVIDLHANSMVAYPRQLGRFRVVLASDNRFQTLPLPKQLSNITRVLDLSRNKISNFTAEFRTFSHLQVLRIKRNYLSTLEFLPRPCGLYVLDISDNSVTNIEGALQSCSKLVFLSLSKNQIARVGAGLFANMKKLKDLFLDSNMIETIPEGAFFGLKSLRCLSLSRNLLQQISPHALGDMPRMRRLDLSSNALTVLPAALLDGAPNLEMLDLHANQLVALPTQLFRDKHALRELRVWKNRLVDLPHLRDCCEHLQVANFDSNNLSSSGQDALNALSSKINSRLRANPMIPP